ncbi:MAG: hypothetical protein RLZZ337_185 [Bacteroidota bacterium]
MNQIFTTLFILFLSLLSIAQIPDYSKLDFWAAHPDKIDASDIEVEGVSKRNIDVFYIYPTIYTQADFTSFSASLDDKKLEEEVESTAIFHQASTFSGIANIYAPFYRQMHYDGYFVTDEIQTQQAKAAMDQAYQDVLKAFLYYLQYNNKGKPFVIAAHSQGTNHAEKLLKEVILPVQHLRKQLVMAYLIGMPIKDNFTSLPPCENATQTGCFVSWRTFGNDSTPLVKGDDIVCTNPIDWTTKPIESDKKEHLGIRFINGKTKAKKSIIAQSTEGYLNIEIVKWPLKSMYKWGNFHAADYNLFWLNIRENFEYRLDNYEAQTATNIR